MICFDTIAGILYLFKNLFITNYLAVAYFTKQIIRVDCMTSKARVFSGIQPSGNLHLGNYLGALKNWSDIQDHYENFFCVVDLHRITVPHDPALQRSKNRELVALYLASGIDPNKSVLFIQSHVVWHPFLSWILNCYTPMGWLSRMTQFKDKSSKQESVSVGLFDYPVLMAADILLYSAQFVPVGEDQKQHLELCRDIAIAFNNSYGDVFTIPNPMIRGLGARIMSLSQPEKKMSKSENDPNGTISVLDTPKAIQKKFSKAVTDSLTEIRFDKERLGVWNLLSIYETITKKSKEDIESHFAGKLYGHLKKEVAELVIEELEPIQKAYNDIQSNCDYIESVLNDGAKKANIVAEETVNKVRFALGLG